MVGAAEQGIESAFGQHRVGKSGYYSWDERLQSGRTSPQSRRKISATGSAISWPVSSRCIAWLKLWAMTRLTRPCAMSAALSRISSKPSR